MSGSSGAAYQITIGNARRITNGQPRLTLDGKPIEGNLLPVLGDGATHRVEVTYEPARVTAKVSNNEQRPEPCMVYRSRKAVAAHQRGQAK